MATESKAVDLGKLQDQVVFYTKKLAEGTMQLNKLRENLTAAQARFDTRMHNQEILKELLDKARQAVLDGARSVAQG